MTETTETTETGLFDEAQIGDTDYTSPQGTEQLFGVLTLAKVMDMDTNEVRYPVDVKYGINNLTEMDYKMLIYTLAGMAGHFQSKGPLQILDETINSSIPDGSDADFFSMVDSGEKRCGGREQDKLDEDIEEVVSLSDEELQAEIDAEVAADMADEGDEMDWSFK